VLSRFAAPSEQLSVGPKEQTQLDITISAASDVNPDEKGRAAPILVRVYELKSEAAFESADYFSLQNNEKAVLGGDLLTREEFIFRPGDVKTIRRKSHPELTVIAVLAGYRELAQSDWRAIRRIEPSPEAAWYRAVLPANKAKLQIKLQAQGVRITAVD
jgi:type VI secretion system protein VasD